MLPHYLEKLKCSNLVHFVLSIKNATFQPIVTLLYAHRFC